MEFGVIYDPQIILGLKFSVSSLAVCRLGRRLDNLVIIGGSSKLEMTTHQNVCYLDPTVVPVGPKNSFEISR